MTEPVQGGQTVSLQFQLLAETSENLKNDSDKDGISTTYIHGHQNSLELLPGKEPLASPYSRSNLQYKMMLTLT